MNILLTAINAKYIHSNLSLRHSCDREIYSNKLSEIAAAIKVQETTVKSIYENGIAAGQWLDDLRENMEIEKLDRMLLVSLIDKILVLSLIHI